MTKEAMEKLKSGAVLVGAEALDVARDALDTASKHPGNRQACRELAKCIEKAEARSANRSKSC